MSRALIGIMSCVADATSGAHEAIRSTWLQRMVPGLDYRFFVGRGEYHSKSDETQLDVDDGYYSLPEKSQAIRKWALEHNYEHVFKADRDTYILPRRLASSGFQNHEYLGHFPGHPVDGELTHEHPDPRGAWPYASGGCGYWTGPRAMEMIVAAPIDDKRLDFYGNPAEDLWIPNIIRPQGIRGWHDSRYQFKGSYLWPGNFTVHLGCGTGQFNPDMMYYAHRISIQW